MKILFLDIDGVLNGHQKDEQGYCRIVPYCVNYLNRVIDATDCKIVLSSAWRYMIHCGAMTLKGFEYMLITHRLKVLNRIIGLTKPDEHCNHCNKESRRGIVCEVGGHVGGHACQRCGRPLPERAEQIRHWLEGEERIVTSWAVVDDDPMRMDFGRDAWRFVRTRASVGLTLNSAIRLARILNKGSE